jgi:hypothetical protein
VYECGDDSEGQSGHRLNENPSPLLISELSSHKITDIEAVPQRNISIAVSVFKEFFVWGANNIVKPIKVLQPSINETLNFYTKVNTTIRPVKRQ